MQMTRYIIFSLIAIEIPNRWSPTVPECSSLEQGSVLQGQEEGQWRDSDDVGEGHFSPICHFVPDPS